MAAERTIAEIAEALARAATPLGEQQARDAIAADWLHYADDYRRVLGDAWTDRTQGRAD